MESQAGSLRHEEPDRYNQTMSPSEISDRLKHRATELGFQLCGICPAVSPPGAARLAEWLAAGYAGEMQYIADRREAYGDPQHVLAGARSIVMLGMLYATEEPAVPGPTDGRVARYAWGEVDYHDLIRDRLHTLADYLRELVPSATTRGVVDTAPLLEREFAQLAGLGWVGKNTLLLSRHAGSYFFLAGLLTDVELEYDAPHTTDHCGTCTACLDACPTSAFPQPYVLDATRCISYLTIEMHGPVPVELRPGMGDWVFGCDVCQEVCPWNQKAPRSAEPSFAPLETLNPLELTSLFDMDEAAFRARFRKSPIWRAHRRGLLRSAAIAMGNRGDTAAIPALTKGLEDEDAIVREACAWALEMIG
jgi:epoxyqueuosine reductase